MGNDGEIIVRQIRSSTNSTVEFGLVPAEHWFQPEWVDEERATKSRQKMQKMGVKYGGTLTLCTCLWFPELIFSDE